MENNAPQKPLFGNSPLGRVLTKRNLVIFALFLIVFDVVLTRYFFNSRQKALFLNNAFVAAREGGEPVALGELTNFDWDHVSISPRVDGTRFWFSTYGTKTYIFDYILDYEAGQIKPEIPSGSVFKPEDRFLLELGQPAIRMLPVHQDSR